MSGEPTEKKLINEITERRDPHYEPYGWHHGNTIIRQALRYGTMGG